jgi:hypothetical protein
LTNVKIKEFSMKYSNFKNILLFFSLSFIPLSAEQENQQTLADTTRQAVCVAYHQIISACFGRKNCGCKPCPIRPCRPMGLQGATGATGACCPGTTGTAGAAGATGARGTAGARGTVGATGTVGAAEFIRTIQTPNDSVAPGAAFTIDTQVFNNIPGNIVASAGAGGTIFTLTAGTYVFDYEMSLGAAGSVAIYTGPTAGSLAIDNNTISGSSTGTTWIHGRAFVNVSTTLVLAISSVVGTAAVVTAGTAAGCFMIRLTILKIA